MNSETFRVENRYLDVSYTTILPSTNPNDPVVALFPGFGHPEKCLEQLAGDLANENIGSARFHFQSKCKGLFHHVVGRNAVGLKSYRKGIDRGWQDFERRTGRKFMAGVGHSQGALLLEETLQRKPKEVKGVLMAPVPLTGAFKAVSNIALNQTRLYFDLLSTFLTKGGMSDLDEEQVKLLFFAANTPIEIIQEAKKMLIHTPLRVFLEDIFRPWLRPEILRDPDRQMLLFRPEKDYLFHPDDHESLRKIYPRMEIEEVPNAGHNFFMEFPRATAKRIKRFVVGNAV